MGKDLLRRTTTILLVLTLSLGMAMGCAQGPAAKKQQALERGQRLLQEGKTAEAIIVLRGALEVDRDFAPALHALGRAYAAKSWAADAARELARAHALAPDSLPIAIDLGRSLIQLGAWKEADETAGKILAREPRNPSGVYIRAAALLGKGQADEAQRIIGAVANDAMTPELESVRADALLRTGHVDQAEAAFRGILGRDAKHSRALIGLGHIELHRGRDRDALALFEQAKGARPDDPEARLGAAEATARLGQRAAAIKELEALEVRARPVTALVTLGRLYIQENRPGEAVPLLAPVVQRMPKFVPARVVLAQAYLATRRLDLAAAECEELVRQVPDEPSFQLWLGTAYRELGRGREALLRFDAVAKAFDKTAPYHIERAGALLLLGRADDALRAAEVGQRLAPDTPQPYLMLGQIRAQQGNTRAAQELFAKAAEVDATYAPARIALGQVFAGRKETEAALKEFDAAVQADPRSLAAVRTKTAALVRRNGPKDAIGFVESAVERDPRSAGFRTLLGALYAMDRQPDKAIAAYRAAVELDPKALEARLGLASLALKQGKERDAIVQLQAAVKDHPDNSLAVLLLATLHQKLAQYDQAIAALEPAVKTAGNQPGFVVMLGDMYLRAGRHDDAIARLSGLIAQAPNLWEARLIRGQAYLAKGDGPAAVKDLSQAVRAAPEAAAPRYFLARALAATGRTSEARAAYGEAIALDPKLERAKLELTALSGGQPDQAAKGQRISKLQEAVKANPRNLAAREQLARAHLASAQAAEAQSELKQILDQAPGHVEANLMMAGVLFRQDKPEDAAAYLRAALKTNPAHVEANLLMARHLQRKARREDALTHLQAALRANPSLVNLYTHLGRLPEALPLAQELERREPKSPGPPALIGWILLDQQSPESAGEAFRRAIKLKPDLLEARRGLGEASQALGQMERAAESYRQALAIGNDDVASLNNLAWILSEVKKKPDEALPLATRAAELAPKTGSAEKLAATAGTLDTLGWVQYRRGAYVEAERVLARAVELSPSNALIHFHLGMTYARLGKKAAASASLRRAADLSPDLARSERIADFLKELGA
jgi:tetratricopeptide (TPR) repeat protein